MIVTEQNSLDASTPLYEDPARACFIKWHNVGTLLQQQQQYTHRKHHKYYRHHACWCNDGFSIRCRDVER